MNKRLRLENFSLAFGLALPAAAQEVLPKPEALFQGKIADTREQSVPAFPTPTQAPKGAPNVVLMLLDDAGFASNSTFGGPAATPELDKLAAVGLRYNQFHTTAICSPTRAALLTGRNHHQVGFGNLSDIATGYPAYNSIWPKSTASVAEVLRLSGLQHSRLRQKAQYAGLGNQPSRTFRPLADDPWVRIFLWLHVRRSEPMVAAALSQHFRRLARRRETRRPKDRRPSRPDYPFLVRSFASSAPGCWIEADLARVGAAPIEALDVTSASNCH